MSEKKQRHNRYTGGPTFPTICTCITEQPRPELCPIHQPGVVTDKLMAFPWEKMGRYMVEEARRNGTNQ